MGCEGGMGGYGVGGIGGLAQVCEARVSRFPGSGYKMKLVESEGESNQIF